jgi:hypothetical protein
MRCSPLHVSVVRLAAVLSLAALVHSPILALASEPVGIDAAPFITPSDCEDVPWVDDLTHHLSLALQRTLRSFGPTALVIESARHEGDADLGGIRIKVGMPDTPAFGKVGRHGSSLMQSPNVGESALSDASMVSVPAVDRHGNVVIEAPAGLQALGCSDPLRIRFAPPITPDLQDYEQLLKKAGRLLA